MPRSFALLASAAVAVAVTVAHADAARASVASDPPPDPYTRGDPKAMARAGYASFGPFDWAAGHTTDEIVQALGGAPLLFVETAHFKIGSSLKTYKPRGSKQRRKIAAELRALRRTLPRVPGTPKSLDRWLRLHLFAARMEAVYADLKARLGVADDHFPAVPGQSHGSGEWRGDGPFLGMREKFTVLLVERTSSMERYYRAFIGDAWGYPKRFAFGQGLSLFFGTATEYGSGWLHDDTALHCHVVYNVVQNLLKGYLGYRRELPLWWRLGLAQFYCHGVDPRWNNYDRSDGRGADTRAVGDWRPRAWSFAKHGTFRPAEEMLRIASLSEFSFDDFVQAFARVDFLLRQDGDGVRAYMDVMKDPTWQMPAGESTRTRQQIALHEAWGLDFASFDARWRRWVIRAYRK